jgi:site-specific DNA recombinase
VRAAIYLRVSTAAQAGAGHVSLDVQRERCEEYCASREWSVAALEVDTESGLKSSRVGYQKIIELARRRSIDTVIVHSASRFGRKASEVLVRTEELRELGVELHSTAEDLSNFLMLGIQAVMNEEESRRIAARSVPARRRRAAAGYWLAHAPFGTKNNAGVLEADDRADILRGMFERAAAGTSVRQITLWANELLTAPMTREGVREILRNVAYVGKTKWAGEVHTAAWQPIVDPELWKRAQAVVTGRKNQRAPIDARRPHWLIGLAYCGACGHRMIRRIAEKTWGTRYEYIACGRRDNAKIRVGCGSRHLQIRPLQARLLEELRQVVRLDAGGIDDVCAEIARGNAAAAADVDERRSRLMAERSRLVARTQKARQAYFDDVYDKTEYHRAVNGIRDAIAVINEQLELPAEAAGVDVDAFRRFLSSYAWFELADTAPLEFRDLLATFIERIEVGPTNIVWRREVAAAVAFAVST